MREFTLDKLPKRVLSSLDMETVFAASRCVVAAEKLQVFRKLHGKILSVSQISHRTGIKRRYCQPFLDYLVYLGFLVKREGLYGNSALTDKHFVEARSSHWTRFWSEECTRDYDALSVLEEVVTSGKAWQEVLGKKRLPDYDLVQKDPRWARDFIYALYDVYGADADLLAKNLDLSNSRNLLDVGGGSGVFSFALVRANPLLKACILDFKYVCETAREIIRKERLSRRVTTMVGDMNKAIPDGFDTIMFWNIGRIDHRVMKMACDRLPVGGLIVRSCSPSRSAKTPPANVFTRRYISVRPEGQSKDSIMSDLREAGFRSVKYRRISGRFAMITGQKH
jgi:cyclopropane fatty-acyl-phospholipid synthase-like methyltransferase